MLRNSDREDARAEAKFKKQQEARHAWAEHAAQANAVYERTTRLKALRLAKVAEEAATTKSAPNKRAG